MPKRAMHASFFNLVAMHGEPCSMSAHTKHACCFSTCPNVMNGVACSMSAHTKHDCLVSVSHVSECHEWCSVQYVRAYQACLFRLGLHAHTYHALIERARKPCMIMYYLPAFHACTCSCTRSLFPVSSYVHTGLFMFLFAPSRNFFLRARVYAHKIHA